MIFHKFSIFISLLFVSNLWAQVDAVQADCDDYSNYMDNRLERKNLKFVELEDFVYQIVYGKDVQEKDFYGLVETINANTNTLYKIDEVKHGQLCTFLRSYRGTQTIGHIFEDQRYTSSFSATDGLWQCSWEYLETHQTDLQTFYQFIEIISQNKLFDMNLACNQRACILHFAKILADQQELELRLNFYEKSKSIALDFYESAGIDFVAFEEDLTAHLHELGFDDSTFENQLFAYTFYTRDRGFMPMPLSENLRSKFKRYHKKLFTQAAFKINESKIVAMPQSTDSITLLKDIMRAYPDSIMFAPGKTLLEIELENLIRNEKNVEDKWFLGVYAGVFKETSRGVKKAINKYSPNDFRSEAFRPWLYLYILQEMFNFDEVEPGVTQVINEYGLQKSNVVSFVLLKTENLENIAVQDGNLFSDLSFNEKSFYVEVFNHELFQKDYNPYVFQLKIDTLQKSIPSEMICNRPLTSAQRKLITDALSKYTFDTYFRGENNKLQAHWIQLQCKRKTKAEEEEEKIRESFYMSDFGLDEVEEIVTESPPVEEVVADGPAEEKVYDFVDVYPSFPGGRVALNTYLKEKTAACQIPKKDQKSGVTYVVFVVKTSGKIENAAVRRGLNKSIDDAALNIVNNMPNWIPGKIDGKTVNVRHTIRVEFTF